MRKLYEIFYILQIPRKLFTEMWYYISGWRLIASVWLYVLNSAFASLCTLITYCNMYGFGVSVVYSSHINSGINIKDKYHFLLLESNFLEDEAELLLPLAFRSGSPFCAVFEDLEVSS